MDIQIVVKVKLRIDHLKEIGCLVQLPVPDGCIAGEES